MRPAMQMLTVTRLGHLGDGIAETSGGPVFVPFALPGETVTGEVAGGRMAAPRIEAASPDRAEPVCPHVGACGGCALQHARDDFVAAWKRDLIAAALAARGLSAEIRPTVTSPPGTRRRVTFAARRTRSGAIAGFHGRADSTLIAIGSCAVADPRIVAALPLCAEIAGLAGSRKGELRLALTVSEAGLDLDVAAPKPLDGPLRAALAGLAARFGLARLSYGGETVAMARPPAQPMGRAQVVPPPGGFLQATPEGEAALVAAVREAVGPARRVADLFAGCGTFALPLAETAAVHAVEADAAALAALDAGWRRAAGLRTVTTEARDLFRRPLRPEEFRGIEAAVLDPPRAGAEAQSRLLAQAPVARLAAVSCNPATFARDARILVDGGFRLEWVQPVDQFRWSPHVELAAAFSRPT